MPTLKDPNGVPLRRVLLQVMHSDAEGPIMLRARRDNETINLDPKRDNTFLMVWVAEDQTLGEVVLSQLVDEVAEMRELSEQRKEVRLQLDASIDDMRQHIERLQEENRVKTEELRTLQRERDPARIDRLVAERVAEATRTLEEELKRGRATVEDRDREIGELKASKKKLREALERAKEGRK